MTTSRQAMIFGMSLGAVTVLGFHPLWAENSGTPTVISGEFYETHDRLPPHEWRGIEFVHQFTFSLSGKGDVSEAWSGRMIAGGTNPEGLKGYVPPSNPNLSPFFPRTSTLGTDSGIATWHVIGERKLQRIYQGEHMLMTMKFTIANDNTCNVEVKFLKQTGFVSIVLPRGDNGQLAEFSLPKVVAASCTIK